MDYRPTRTSSRAGWSGSKTRSPNNEAAVAVGPSAGPVPRATRLPPKSKSCSFADLLTMSPHGKHAIALFWGGPMQGNQRKGTHSLWNSRRTWFGVKGLGSTALHVPDRTTHTQSVATIQQDASVYAADCACHPALKVCSAMPVDHKNFLKNKGFGTPVAGINAAAPLSDCRPRKQVQAPTARLAIRIDRLKSGSNRAEVE